MGDGSNLDHTLNESGIATNSTPDSIVLEDQLSPESSHSEELELTAIDKKKIVANITNWLKKNARGIYEQVSFSNRM